MCPKGSILCPVGIMEIGFEVSPWVVAIPVPFDTPVAVWKLFTPPNTLLPAFSVALDAHFLVGDQECLKSSDAKSVVISFSLFPQRCNCYWKRAVKILVVATSWSLKIPCNLICVNETNDDLQNRG